MSFYHESQANACIETMILCFTKKTNEFAIVYFHAQKKAQHETRRVAAKYEIRFRYSQLNKPNYIHKYGLCN